MSGHTVLKKIKTDAEYCQSLKIRVLNSGLSSGSCYRQCSSQSTEPPGLKNLAVTAVYFASLSYFSEFTKQIKLLTLLNFRILKEVKFLCHPFEMNQPENKDSNTGANQSGTIENSAEVKSERSGVTITRKELWLSVRSKYPKVIIKSNQFKDAVRERLTTMLKIEDNEETEKFISKEVKHFSCIVATIWLKHNRVMREETIEKHKCFFNKILDPNEPIRPIKYKEPKPLEPPEDLILRDRSKISQEDRFQASLKTVLSHFERKGHIDAAFIISQIHRNPKEATKLRKCMAFGHYCTQNREFEAKLPGRKVDYLLKNITEPLPIRSDASNEWHFVSVSKKAKISTEDLETEEIISDPTFVSEEETGYMNKCYCI